MNPSRRPTLAISATCACGAIAMAVDGAVMSMLLCSCVDCQRSTGTGHATVAMVPAAALTVTGSPKCFERPSVSGAIFSRHFCADCGTPLFGQSSRAPQLRLLPVGFFAGQNDWYEPSQLIFARSRQHWDLIADHLPRHASYKEGGAP